MNDPKRHLAALKIALLPIFAALTSPALASDCSHATGAVETAICTHDDLRRLDEMFNRSYSDLIDHLDSRQRDELIQSERLWLTQRDGHCAAKSPADMAGCVEDLMSRREKELAAKFSDGVGFGHVRLAHPGQFVMVGDERLDVLDSKEQGLEFMTLVHGNTLIAESQAPFAIDGRAGDENGEAIVLSTHDYGNLGCSDQYLVSALPKQPLRVEPLRVQDSCMEAFSVRKQGNTLVLTLDASPGRDGVIKIWSSGSGLSFDRALQFSPKRGSTMASFQSDESPTDNEELFNSLKQTVPLGWQLLAQALQFASVRSDDNDKYLVLSPCSGSHGCPAENAFAAYEKTTKKFFFAHEPPELRPLSNKAKTGIIYYPDRANWPTDLLQIVDDWGRGEMRD